MDLVEFLRARLDEIEVLARRASTVSPAPWRVDAAAGAIRDAHGAEVAGHWRALPSLAGTVGPDHIVRDDPARVLAEVEAKRRIVNRHSACDDVSYGDPSTCPDLRDLALPYAGHPDYDERWRP